jgi:hypothetical protein
VDTHASALEQRGFTWIREELPHPDTAFELARELVAARWPVDGREAPIVVGDFVLPPLDGAPTRGFQTLHFAFGLPLDPRVPKDLGRSTALYVSPHVGPVSAATRLVPLRALLCQRCWPARDELLERLSSYGRTHGAWDDRQGYVEGSLARLVEAAAGERALPSVKLDPSFLCGMEFDSVTAEAAFFERHLLSLERVEVQIGLGPGNLLVFDNLSLAHGRSGTRRPGELRQWVFGDRELDIARQCAAREEVLSAFDEGCAGASLGVAEATPVAWEAPSA